MQSAGLPGVPTPCQAPCLTPVRQRSAVAATDLPSGQEEALEPSPTARPVASTPEASPPSPLTLSTVHSPPANFDGWQSPTTAQVRTRKSAVERRAADATAIAAGRCPKPALLKDGPSHVPLDNQQGVAHFESLTLPSMRLASSPNPNPTFHGWQMSAAGASDSGPCLTNAQTEAELHGSAPAEVANGVEHPCVGQRCSEHGQQGDGSNSDGQAVGCQPHVPKSSRNPAVAKLFSPAFTVPGNLKSSEILSEGPSCNATGAIQASDAKGGHCETVIVKADCHKEAVQPPAEEDIHSENDVYSENDTQIRVHCAHTGYSQVRNTHVFK